MKELRKVYMDNVQYHANVRTRLVTKQVDGQTVYCDDTESSRVLRRVEQRARAASAKRDREDVLRSCGLVKVRGALGGVYWE